MGPARCAVAAVSAVLCVMLAACSPVGAGGDAADRAGRGESPPTGSASADGSAGPGAGGSGASADPDEQSAGANADQPLVIATHHTSRLRELSLERARRVVAGSSRLEVADGPPKQALRSVVRDPDTVAVVPAAALDHRVRAVRVAGVDPVRRPGAYPLRTPADRPQPSVVSMTVVGDIMLARGVAAANPEPARALRHVAPRLRRADIAVGNLESTLSRAGSPTQGGDSFAASPRVARGLRDAGFDALSLANNHLGDFGERALVRTVRRLRAAGLSTFGAGATPRQAWRPTVVERDGLRFGFLGFNAIGETPEVAPGRPGAVSVSMPPRTGPLDRAELRRFTRAVRRLDRRVDVVVVLPHWGTQYTNRPEPIQRRVARRVVDAGADVVVGGHPHWLQAAETVRGRLVVHSLGNLVFDMDFMRRTMEGAMLELTFWGDELKGARFVPYVMDQRFAPRVVDGRRGERVLDTMRETSGPAFRG